MAQNSKKLSQTKQLTRTGIAVSLMFLLLGCNSNVQKCQHSVSERSLYGAYSPGKTVDYLGNIKTPAEELDYVKLNNDNGEDVYELVFKNGKRSTGKITHDFGYAVKGESGQDFVLNFSLELVDYKNANEPSYVFYLRVELDASICVLQIPQGAGDNSWIQTADFWYLERYGD
jgi:hypothetical protein